MQRLRTIAAGAAVLALVGPASALASGTSAAPASATPGLADLVDDADAGAVVTGIATFDAVPSAAAAGALRQLGLEVQPMRHVPLAIVRGPVAAMEAAVALGVADDVYPDEPVQLLDTESSDAMGAAVPRIAGLTGLGVTVAVVDSGCDATHPDLADHVTHNVKVVSPEYVNGPIDSWNTIAVPVDMGPYSNTDVDSGHGTHVAGIIAADGTTGPANYGVAPDAELVCIAIGEGLFTTAVVTAYDYLLDQPDMWGVDVINNSWGNLYAQFDPRHPMAVITDAVTQHGALVVFAAGNSGDSNGEATLNPFSQYPWVLSVAAAEFDDQDDEVDDPDHTRASFSSNGLLFDNSDGSPIGPGGRTSFEGERIGLVHPDVTAPGVAVRSTCGPTALLIGPCEPGGYAEARGTSMASPHVAGAAAVLLQVNPDLTPSQVRWALQSTAVNDVLAVDDDDEVASAPAPFWQVGFGHVDLAAAVDAARPGQAESLQERQRKRNAEVLDGLGYDVVRTDWLTYDSPRATLGGSDTRSFEVTVPRRVSHLHVTVAFPSTAALTSTGITLYTVNVFDAAGNVVATSERSGEGSATTPITGIAPGTYTIEVVGDLAASDPDTIDSDSLLNDSVTVVVAQLRAH